jgi:hypothetical protein
VAIPVPAGYESHLYLALSSASKQPSEFENSSEDTVEPWPTLKNSDL